MRKILLIAGICGANAVGFLTTRQRSVRSAPAASRIGLNTTSIPSNLVSREGTNNMVAALNTASIPPNLVPPQETNSIVARILKEPRRAPPFSEIPRLSALEEKRLIEAYRGIPSPTNRYGIIATLAFGGGDDSGELLRYSLEEEFAGRSLQDGEEDVLLLTARFLGVLASQSPKARALLLNGGKNDYWSQRQPWKSERRIDHLLASYCTQGIGLLPDAKVILNQIVNGGFNEVESRQMWGAVVNAAAYADEIEIYGRDHFFGNIFMQERSFDYYKQWRSSDRAQPWIKWAQAYGYPVPNQNAQNAK